MLTEISNNWLDEELQQFDCSENLQQEAILFKEKVREALSNSLLKPKWKLEEFLTLIIACNMADEFCTTHNMQPYIDINRRAFGEYYTYPLTQWNVCEIKQRLSQYYIHALALLKQRNHNTPIEALPIEWLELVESIGEQLFIPSVEKYFYKVIWPTSPEPGTYRPPKTIERIESSKRPPIVTLMAELIRFYHYGIDILIAKRGIFPVSRLNIDEAAKYLGISTNQIIEKCFEEKTLGVYIKEGQFNIKKFITISSQCRSRNYIDEISIASYPHHYKGLVRLVKSSELYPDKTVEKIYEGSNIEASQRTEFANVPLQSSTAEYVQGITKVIELRRGEKITIGDLILVQSELQQFKDNDAEIAHPLLDTPNQFFRVGNTYKISYLGEQLFYLPDDKGLRRIEYLLKRPKQYVLAILLMQLDSEEEIKMQPLENIEELRESGINEDSHLADNDLVIPSEQIQQYRRRAEVLKQAIEEAREFGEIEKVEQYKQELDFLLTEINKNTNHIGRPRTFNNESRTVLNSLRKSLKRSYENIKIHSPALYEHLNNSIQIAHQTVYHPLNECIWNEDKCCRQ